MRNLFHWLLLAFIFFQATLGAATLNVAVENLLSSGISAAEASIISDRLRSELLEIGSIRVMERSQMDQILKEQSFQQSGACVGSQCFVEIGRLLAVDRIVVGTVGSIGSLYTLSVRVLNVETGEVIFSVNEDFVGPIEGLLQKSVPELAQKLSTGLQGGKIPGKADLYATASEEGASIEIDGEPKGVSPVSLEGLNSGDHTVIARKGNLFGSVAVHLDPDDLKKVLIPMKTGSGSIKVNTQPQGAEVILDQRIRLGQTPLKADSIPAGNHTLEIKLSGHITSKLNIQVNVGQVSNIKNELIAGGLLDLHSSSVVLAKLSGPGGQIREILTDGNMHLLEPGTWTGSIDNALFESQQFSFEIEKNTNQSRQIVLDPKFGILKIKGPIHATVWNGSTKLGVTPFSSREIAPGKLDLRLERQDLLDTSFQVEISKGQTTSLTVAMKPKYGSLEVVSNFPATLWNRSSQLGSTPYSNYQELPGILDLRLEGAGLVDSVFQATIVRGQKTFVSVDMQHNQAWKDSVASAKQDRFRMNVRGGTLGASLLSAALAVNFHLIGETQMKPAYALYAVSLLCATGFGLTFAF
jgi:hypothetical protein